MTKSQRIRLARQARRAKRLRIARERAAIGRATPKQLLRIERAEAGERQARLKESEAERIAAFERAMEKGG